MIRVLILAFVLILGARAAFAVHGMAQHNAARIAQITEEVTK